MFESELCRQGDACRKKMTSQKCKHMFLILLSWPFKHGSQWCFFSIFQSAGFSLVATHFSLTFSNLDASIVCWMFEQIDSTHCRAITAINWERTHFSLEFFALSPPSIYPSILSCTTCSRLFTLQTLWIVLSLSFTFSLSHADDNLSIRGKSIYKLNKMTWYPSSPLVHQPVQTRSWRLASRQPGSSETAP